MTSEYRVEKHALAQRYFTCATCGAQGEVSFGAEGSSGWRRGNGWLPDDEARVERSAETDLRTDAMRTQALIACPTCGARAPGAMRWVGIRIGFWIALAAAMALAGGAHLLIGAGLCGAMAVWQAWRERGRLLRADGAVIALLVPGKIPVAERPRPAIHRQLAPPPDLPAARVVAAPAVHEEPVDPTAPPKFLKP